jgi:shikimate dehydrogenase
MNGEKKLGLIGKNISYSFSKKYFGDKFHRLMLKDWSYELFELDEIQKVLEVFNKQNLKGLNVTIPYKEKIIPYLDELSEEAAKIGAVNTVLIRNGKKKGYNTDAYGFEKSFKLFKKNHHKSALILGNGGASKAVQYVLEKMEIPYETVFRNGDLTFENLTPDAVSRNAIIVHCTPVGTFPNVDQCVPFPFEGLTASHLVIDLIYNPNETKFLKNAAGQGARTTNGLFMLEQQAEKAWEIWNA